MPDSTCYVLCDAAASVCSIEFDVSFLQNHRMSVSKLDQHIAQQDMVQKKYASLGQWYIPLVMIVV